MCRPCYLTLFGVVALRLGQKKCEDHSENIFRSYFSWFMLSSVFVVLFLL